MACKVHHNLIPCYLSDVISLLAFFHSLQSLGSPSSSLNTPSICQPQNFCNFAVSFAWSALDPESHMTCSLKDLQESTQILLYNRTLPHLLYIKEHPSHLALLVLVALLYFPLTIYCHLTHYIFTCSFLDFLQLLLILNINSMTRRTVLFMVMSSLLGTTIRHSSAEWINKW